MNTEQILANEPALRGGVFFACLIGFALAEILSPRRRVEIPRLLRWSNNLALLVLDTIVIRLLFPILAVGLAIWAGDAGWGLFNLLDLPFWFEFLAALLLFDLAIYIQHVVFHHVPFLWRLHRVHHADLEFDVTTGIRFHPAEIVLSMLYKLALVLLIGPAALAVLVFEVVLNASALFNHSNLALPRSIDRVLRLFIVTPDMHRVHHSVDRSETDSNFGFNLPWWDWLFRTYHDQPGKGHEGMEIGIGRFKSTRELWVDRMLLQPFRRSRRD